MIQNKYKRWLAGVLLFSFILLMNAGTALGQSSANYKIKKSVLDQGGAPSQSANFKATDVIGQPSPVTVARSANYSVASGFFAGGAAAQTPLLFVTPTTLDFGSTQTSLTFQISNNGSGTLTWNVNENPDKLWITSVSPSSGSGNATVAITINRTGMNPGNYTGKVTVTSNGGTQDIIVNMTVSDTAGLWETQISGTSNRLNYVAPTSNQEVWVAGNNGTVLRTTDGGQTWSNVWNGAAGTTFYTIEAVDANTALVSTWTGGANVAQLYRTSDGGQSWAMVFEQTNGFINNITLFDQNQGMTIGDPVGGVWTVLQTRNGGQTWTPITNAPAAVAGDYAGPYSINWVDQSTCWFGSIKSNIFQTTNGGTSWNAGVISLLTSVNSLAFNANGTGLAAYFEGQVARTRDGGSSWETISLPGSGILRYLLSSQNAFWLLRDKSIYNSNDDGESWQHRTTSDHALRHLAFSSKQAGANGWAVGDNGTILRYKQDTGNNILVNGDFSNGASPWWLFVDPSAAASGSVQNGEYAVSITDGSTVDWYIQLLQSNVPIENGKTYTVSFDAYAASPRQIAFYIRKASAPHTLYSGYQTFALTASKQNYSLTFTMNDPTDNIADFSFVLGTSNVDVFFDNVTLTEQSVQTPALLVTPTTLDFGATQTSLTFQISNSGGGTLTWNVTENPDKTWITSVLPASGSDGATVTVNVDRAQLTGNNDTGTLVVSSNGGTQNITVLISRTGGQATITPDAPATAPAGQEFWVAVVVDHVNDLFGVSLDLDYPTAYLNYVQSEISNPGTGSANLLGSDLLFFDTPDDPNGKVSFGITRKSGQGGISGSGPVVWAKFVSLASTPDLTQVTWSCTNVTANDASGNTMTLTPQSATTTISTGCIVWPGDTNNDGIVNQADVLPVGLHWNKTGPARPNATTQWIGQFCPPWNPQAATYADANGDGTVNQADVLPIGLNWQKTHGTMAMGTEFATSFVSLNKSNTPSLGCAIIGDTDPGKEFFVEIHSDSVSNLFGIAFELVYSPTTYVKALAVGSGAWMGSDVIFFANIDTTTGVIGIGISRKAGQGGVNGSGMVAKVKMRMSTNASVGDITNLTLQNVVANDPAGRPIAYEVRNASIVTSIEGSQPAHIPVEFALSQNYPNPFNPETRIRYVLPKSSHVRMVIFTLLGQKIRTLVNEQKPPGTYTVLWDGRLDNGKQAASGVYIYRLQTEEFESSRKLLLLR